MPLINRSEAEDTFGSDELHSSACECGKWFNGAQVIDGKVKCKECGAEKSV
tara:strand:+ start:24424 stop:24576 length:153 start_codon:yes stop_codon:yes gene_type:complete